MAGILVTIWREGCSQINRYPGAEMTTGQFRRWKIKYDAEATRNAYAEVSQGCPEQCGCDTCKNFAAARRYAYPPEVSSFLEQLGIDTSKEPEVYHNARLDTGLQLYG